MVQMLLTRSSDYASLIEPTYPFYTEPFPLSQIGHCPPAPRWQPDGSLWLAACRHKAKRCHFRKTYKLNLYKPFWLSLRARGAITGANKGLADLQDGQNGWISGRMIPAVSGWQAMPSPRPSPTGRGSNSGKMAGSDRRAACGAQRLTGVAKRDGGIRGREIRNPAVRRGGRVNCKE